MRRTEDSAAAPIGQQSGGEVAPPVLGVSSGHLQLLGSGALGVNKNGLGLLKWCGSLETGSRTSVLNSSASALELHASGGRGWERHTQPSSHS